MHHDADQSPNAAGMPGEAAVRVAFFSDAFPERNGTGAYYHDLAAQLAGRVQALEVFQPAFDGKKPLLSIAMPGDAGQRLVTPPTGAIRRRCREFKPTVIVVVTPGLYGLLGVLLARRRNAALLCAFHTDFEQLARLYWNPIARFFVNIVLRTANHIVCRFSRCVLINNEGLRGDVEDLGARRVEVIGTPLAQEFLQRPLQGSGPPGAQVCFVGRLAPEKNVEHILHAARDLPAVEFVIVGEGPLREALEAAARDLPNVRFTGWLDRGDLISVIDSSRLLLLPSAFETFGSVALEAMARGRPALVSRTAGIYAWPELREGLYDLGEPGELAQRIGVICALSDEAWLEKSAAARRVAEDLNESTIAHWAELLRRHQQAEVGGLS